MARGPQPVQVLIDAVLFTRLFLATICAPFPVRCTVDEEAAMRAEAEKHVDSIEEALVLLRRHL